MAIRDKFRRIRKSVSSISTSQADQNSDSSTESTKSPLRLAKSMTWRSSKEEKKKNKPDPREKPFTETNLKHQELLSTFTMTFGARKGSLSGRPSYGGVSPGASRQGSLDGGAATGPDGYRRVSSIAPDMTKIETVQEDGRR